MNQIYEPCPSFEESSALGGWGVRFHVFRQTQVVPILLSFYFLV